MPSPDFDAARIELARLSVSADRPFRVTLHDVAEVAARALGVERVSVWRLLDDRQSIRCHFLYQPGRPDVTDGAILYARDFPQYFRMIDLRRVVRVNDVAGDPLAAEFRDAYFDPLGIAAMLDAPVYQVGHVAAIVCHEHLHAPREWTTAEAEFAAAVADTIARLYGESLLTSTRDVLGTYRRQVEDLRNLGALGRLAAGMAHDFRNVLQAVEGYAELIAENQAEPRSAGLATNLLGAVGRGRHLVDSLLRLGRPTPSKPRVVDVATLLTEAAPLLKMTAGPRIAFSLEAAPALPRVLIDPRELERGLMNLVANARDAMPEGGTIGCSAYEQGADESGDATPVVVIEVRDNGTGMDRDTVAQIFEPFFTTKGDTGSGLGLSIVRQCIVMAGGSVDASSAPGEGTSVRLCLPAIGQAPRRQDAQA